MGETQINFLNIFYLGEKTYSKYNSNKNEFFKFQNFLIGLSLFGGDKTIDFEARIVEGDKTLHLGDLGIVPIK